MSKTGSPFSVATAWCSINQTYQTTSFFTHLPRPTRKQNQAPLQGLFYCPMNKTTLAIPPAPKPVFPTMGSLQEVIDLAESRLPITNKNDLTAILATYHNTLLNLLK